MAKIAIASGSMAGVEHIYDTCLIGRALADAGHEIFIIADDLGRLHSVIDASAAPKLMQSPLAEGYARQLGAATERPEGFAVQLAQSGFSDLETLRLLAGAWKTLLQTVAPDVVIALSSPGAWLIGPTIAPTFAIGRGAMLPPMTAPNVLSTSNDAPAIDPAVLLDTVNVAMAELELERLNELPDLLWRCHHSHFGLDLLDPYSGSRLASSLGALGATTNVSNPRDGGGLAVFLDADYPGIDSLVLALSTLGDVELHVFVRKAKPAMRRFLSGCGQVRWYHSFAEAFLQAGKAAAIVHHGVSAMAEQGLLNGQAQLVLPWSGEQQTVLESLKNLGVAWWKDPDRPVIEWNGTLRGVLHDEAVRNSALSHHRSLQERGVKQAAPELLGMMATVLAPAPASSIPGIQSRFADRGEVKDRNVAVTEQKPDETLPVQQGRFCGLPFEHLCITTEGTSKICCVSQEYVTEDGVPLTLYRNELDEIWNSRHMRSVRRAMAEGQPLKECEVCYANERATGESYRTSVGILPLGGRMLDAGAVRETDESNDYRVSTSPSFIKLELGNLCNLKCRMCYGGNSSEIERDTVHSRWNGGDEPMHAVWRGEVAVVGPESRIGVRRTGVYAAEEIGGQSCSWTDGCAQLEFPVGPRNRLTELEIEFHASEGHGQTCYVHVNNQTLFRGKLESGRPIINIDLREIDFGRSAKIEIESGTRLRQGDSRPLGLPLVSVKVKREFMGRSVAARGAEVLDLKLSAPGLWYQSDELVFGKLLADLSRLDRFFVTGGEPLLEPRFFEIVDWLIARGAAERIELEIVTNATRFSEEIAAKLAAFRGVYVSLSLDGTGDVFEYMRYPARWDSVAKNVKCIKSLLPDAKVTAIPVIQAYNVLNIADICRFSADNDVAFLANFIQTPPRLKVENLPATVVRTAGRKLRAYADAECPDTMRSHVQAIAHYLETCVCGNNPALLREFMLFTNDLDLGRNQSMRNSVPDLYSLIAQGGFKWTDETAFVDAKAKRRSARDRIHAWV
jgi:MoaA/NifB/PqqE/SkfB family radical SAM enzyme